MVSKIVFSITFNVCFWCSKEPSHHEDSFEHQKCLAEYIIVDLRIFCLASVAVPFQWFAQLRLKN